MLAAALLLPPDLASAQEETQAAVELRLTRQTLVTTPERPLRIRIAAAHLAGPRLRDLAVSLWVYNPARSRSAYAQWLGSEEAPTEPLLVAPFLQRGPLASGQSRAFTIVRRLPELAEREENALYPVKVQLESEGVAVAALRTVMVFIQERPLVPLNVSMTFVLDVPLPLRPDGAFSGVELERAIAPGGRISTIVSALERHPVPVTVAVSPLLLEGLGRMSTGYRVVEAGSVREIPADAPEAVGASEMLDRIRTVARRPSTEVVALPYATPSLPSLAAAGLGADLRTQIEHGRAVVEDVLGAPTSAEVFRPPDSEVSPDALDILASLGVRSLILDPETAPPPPDLLLSPPATARVGPGLDALAPDPGVAGYLGPAGDVLLQAAHALGELSTIYFEEPSVVRGVAIVVGEQDLPGLAFLNALLRPLADPPAGTRWLQPKTASAVISSVPPEELPPGQQRRRVQSASVEPLSPGLVAAIRDAQGRIEQFRTMAGGALALTDRLRNMLLIAESGDFIDQEQAAFGFVTAVFDTLDREFAKIELPSGAVTLASQRGVIPVTVRTIAEYDVRIRVTLLSPRLDFLEGATQEVVLSGEPRALTFPVRAQTTGRFPVRILVDTPGGRRITESQIVVRSTAYNRVALFITIGAAVFLALWWGRRFLRRATS